MPEDVNRRLDTDPRRVVSAGDRRRVEQLTRRAVAIEVKHGRGSPDAKVYRDQIAAIAEEALKRSLGIERFMVLEVGSEQEAVKRFQLLSVTLDYNKSSGRWRWDAYGRNVRTDGRLGIRTTSVYINKDAISRRSLTGEWIPITPLTGTCH